MNDQTDPRPIHGQFSSSLRNQPVWKVIGPVLTTQARTLTESHLSGYDFNFHWGNGSQPLPVLFLTPSSLNPENKEQTISQLTNFSTSVSTPERCIIALLLSEDPFTSAAGKCNLDALLSLQVLYDIHQYPMPLH